MSVISEKQTMDCHCTDILFVGKYQGLFIVSVRWNVKQMGEKEGEGGWGVGGAIVITERALPARPNGKRCPHITASPPNLRCSSYDTHATII